MSLLSNILKCLIIFLFFSNTAATPWHPTFYTATKQSPAGINFCHKTTTGITRNHKQSPIPDFDTPSPYQTGIYIPPYDPNNPEMFLISKKEDWQHINDPDIRYFYVVPGDYSETGLPENDNSILLTASGTPLKRRYIFLYNGNNIHPGKLDTSQLAKVGFILKNANYWVIDRMAYWEREDGFIPIIMENSSHNVINRFFANNVAGGMIYILSNSNDNTVQNCRIQRDNINLHLDRAAIALSADNGTSVKNSRILNNEVYNFVDGFQAVADKEEENNFVNYEGTIVDGNLFIIDESIYTDCHGNHNSDGECAYAENAIDLKSGSENPANPFIITNNVMWGYRKADTTNSDLDDVGSAMVCHYNVNNVIIYNNLFYDSTRALTVGGPVNGWAMRNSIFSNNIIYRTKNISIKIYDSENITFENNLFKETGVDFVPGEYSVYMAFINCTSIFVENCLSVNTYDQSGVRIDNSTVYPSNNSYYNSTPGDMENQSDIILTIDPALNYYDLSFTINKYTNNPSTITIPKVLKFDPSKKYSPCIDKNKHHENHKVLNKTKNFD